MKTFRVLPLFMLMSVFIVANASGALPFNVDLSQDGYQIAGLAMDDETGFAVTLADVDGDSFCDLLFSAPHAEGTGVVYVVYGSADFGTGAPLDLSKLKSNGVVIKGEAQGDQLGASVINLGDLNGDSKDDIMIAAPGYDNVNPALTDVGRCYLIYGRDKAGFPETLSLSDPGARDLTITGEAALDALGLSLGTGGNFGGDDFPVSILIGAPLKDVNNWADGAAYVVYWDSGLTGDTDVTTLITEGKCAVLTGSGFFDNAGCSVAGGFDFNNDGYGDIVVGAPGASTANYISPGTAYLVYGDAEGLAGTQALDTLHAAQDRVVAFLGASDYEQAGYSAVGLVNDYVDNDNFDSFAVSAPMAGPNGARSGRVYVIQGTSGFESFTVDLDSLGDYAYTLNGPEALDGHLGYSLSALGDINNDGNGDFAVGTAHATPGTLSFAGVTYIIYGSRFYEGEEKLSVLTPQNPMIIGADFGDLSGSAIAGNGDVNNDGYMDFIVGSRGYSEGGEDYMGCVHFIAGDNTANGAKGLNDMTITPYLDVRGDLTPGSTTGFDLYVQVDTGWSQQAAGDIPSLMLVCADMLDHPGLKFRNCRVWTDLTSLIILISITQNHDTGELTIPDIIIPTNVDPGTIMYVQNFWKHPDDLVVGDYAATNCICIEIP